MARVLITGSTTGLGLGAAHELIDDGHEIVFHARNAERARELPDTADVVIGDLGEPDQVRDLAEQIAHHEPVDAVIHNAGLDATATREVNSLGQPLIVAVNVYAPYVLTALMGPVPRLIYLSSNMHEDGGDELDDLDWTRRRWHGTQAYRDSKLQVTALAFAIADRWSEVRSNAVDPGWVPPAWAARRPATTSSSATAPRHGWRSATTTTPTPPAGTGSTSRSNPPPQQHATPPIEPDCSIGWPRSPASPSPDRRSRPQSRRSSA